MAWVTSTEMTEKKVWEYPRISSASISLSSISLFCIFLKHAYVSLCVYLCV